jgi:phosphatidate cytidylyltransferase
MLIKRVATVAVLLPLFLCGLFFLPTRVWGIALLAMLGVGAYEWARLIGVDRSVALAYALATIGAGLGWLALSGNQPGAAAMPLWALATVFWALVVPLWLWRGWQLRSRLLGMLTGLLVLFPAWLALVALQSSPGLLLALMGVVWVADSMAYFAGHRWGRRKLAPSISPGKTWEGVAGAVVGVAVYHAAVWHWALAPVMPGAAVALAVLVAAMVPLSILGDLFESLLKRQAGVKDSGTLLPGHGGVLDRIDALTSTLPLAALAVGLINGRMA